MTTKATAAEVAEPLGAGFPPVTDGQDQWLAATLFRLLAKGEPVDTARLA